MIVDYRACANENMSFLDRIQNKPFNSSKNNEIVEHTELTKLVCYTLFI